MSDQKESQPKNQRSTRGSSAIPPRKLTTFLCQEMLYDYATDRLDGERKTAVEEFLKQEKEGSASCNETLNGIKKAIAYGELLAGTQISEEMALHLKEAENAHTIGRKYSSFTAWPDSMRWAIMCLLLVIGIAGAVSAVPWKRLTDLRNVRSSNTIEIAALATPNPDAALAQSESGEADAANDVESSGDEEDTGDEAESESGVAPTKPGLFAKAIEKQSPSLNKESLVDKSLSVLALPLTTKQESKPSGSSVQDSQVNASATSKHNESAEAQAKGFVYRAFMTLSDLDEIGPKITTDIEGLGGERAGEVELGWKRGTGRYYHFSIPEVNQDKLLERLRAYGPVRISKDPHPRVMPKGQLRFILWVESPNA